MRKGGDRARDKKRRRRGERRDKGEKERREGGEQRGSKGKGEIYCPWLWLVAAVASNSRNHLPRSGTCVHVLWIQIMWAFGGTDRNEGKCYWL